MNWGSLEVSMHQRCLLTGSLMPHLQRKEREGSGFPVRQKSVSQVPKE